jgi:hypothetical protein
MAEKKATKPTAADDLPRARRFFFGFWSASDRDLDAVEIVSHKLMSGHHLRSCFSKPVKELVSSERAGGGFTSLRASQIRLLTVARRIAVWFAIRGPIRCWETLHD